MHHIENRNISIQNATERTNVGKNSMENSFWQLSFTNKSISFWVKNNWKIQGNFIWVLCFVFDNPDFLALLSYSHLVFTLKWNSLNVQIMTKDRFS